MTLEKRNNLVETTSPMTNRSASRNPILKRSLMRTGKHLAGLVSLVLLPALLPADCIPTGPDGYTVPFSMVTLKNDNGYASYTNGSLFITNYNAWSKSGTTLSAGALSQLFSDRYAPPIQPFSVDKIDLLGVAVSDLTLEGVKAPITVTLTLESWGNAKQSFTGSCDASTGELYASVDKNTFIVLTFGTPVVAPPPPPK